MVSLIQKYPRIYQFILFLIFIPGILFGQKQEENNAFCIVMHGGAGNFTEEDLTPAEMLLYKSTISEALNAGYKVLAKGGASVDAVIVTIKILEDSPLFNAGKGAVQNDEGNFELDAAIMDGKTLNAGAVSGIKHIKNPIELAYVVMEESRHVMLYGEGAENFAKDFDLDFVENSYFDIRPDTTENGGEGLTKKDLSKYGTVGAVALDKLGNIAAGTSTGGLRNKKYGRIGDSPIIGAGTYANNSTCGISCTGIGEYFIRGVVAHDISAMMEYKKMTLQKAAEEVIMHKLVEMGGSGGMIGLDSYGRPVMVFNTSGMIRGFINEEGMIEVEFF